MTRNKFSCAILALSVFSLFIAIPALSGSAIAACPEINKSTVFDSRQLVNDSRISIEPSDTANALSLNIYTNCQSSHKKIEVATFQTEGSAPHVESVFFQKIRGRENVFAIVSWKINSRGDGTYGTYYEVHAYQEDSGGVISENHVVSENQHMSGIDGYQMGQESIFPYKTATDVRGFWRKNDSTYFKK
ncbi:hypothetical protein [Pandoraea fibrosis]|uniref:Lipoprotein n=1 Tax=Pandoraea fibrosis TaxID=1891094 RepID=A0A5E4W3X4_9BURK|nr:hypothetical protein [Pandoraea fibrosis]VVE19627.1 hypothetical protein PFI31113_03038 [Pandoraea fibrosis]